MRNRYESDNLIIEVDLFMLIIKKNQHTIVHFINGISQCSFYCKFVRDLNTELHRLYDNKEFINRCKRIQVTRIENLIKYTDKILESKRKVIK